MCSDLMNHIDVHVYRQMIGLVGLANNSDVEVCFLCNTFCGLFPVTLFNASFFFCASIPNADKSWNFCVLAYSVFSINNNFHNSMCQF